VPPPRRSAANIAIALAFLVIGTIAGLLRVRGPGAADTLYAEDGEIFLTQALHKSTWHAVTTPYVGYLHLAPRSIAEVVARLPVGESAAAIAGAGSLVVAALGLLVFRATAGLIRSRLIRAALAVTIVLLPTAQIELLDAIANLHWYLMAVSVVVLFWNPTSRVETGIGALVLFVTAMSDPLTILLAPLALVRFLLAPTRRAKVVPIAMTVGLVLQLTGMKLSHATRQDLHPDPNPLRIAALSLVHVVGRAVFGMRFLPDGATTRSRILTVVAMLIVGTAVLFVARRVHDVVPIMALLAITAIASYAGPVVLSGESPPRYAVVAIVSLLTALAIVVDRAIARLPRPRASMLAGGAGVLFVLVLAVNFRMPTPREKGPRWSVGVREAKEQCGVTPRGDATITIAPLDQRGWTATVPCRELS
jgi:hypothetical protein